jgi:multidrug resistance efflux pump
MTEAPGTEQAAETGGTETQKPPEGEDTSAQSVKRGSLGILAVIILSLAWYLAADRHTPYTTQARVQGYVVGVAPKVAGLVTEVFVVNDQEVEAQTPLFQIDQSQYAIAVDKAQSDLESAQRQVDAGRAGVESARAGLRAAQANKTRAEKDLHRLERLRQDDPGTISMRRLEGSQASLDQAIAKVAAAQADVQRSIEQMGGDDDAANAILKSARSALEKAQLDLDNTLIRAEAPGMVTDLRTDVGQFAATGNPVMTLISVRDIWIDAEFTENNLGNMQTGTPVEILFDVLPGAVFDGRVRSIGLGVGSGQSHPPGTLPTIDNDRDWLRQSQRFSVLIDLDRAAIAELKGNLRIGGQASVISYNDDSGLLSLLGRIYIRIMSILSYAY